MNCDVSENIDLIVLVGSPGIPYTPSIFATLGWLPPLLLFAAFAIISAFSVLFIIEAMQALPGTHLTLEPAAISKPFLLGNRHFQGTVEFATLVHFYFGPVEHLIAQLLLYGAIQSQAMNNIVLSAQTFDNILVDIFHKTCGITLPGGNVPVGWHCFSNNNSTTYAVSEVLGNSPFGSQPILFSLGLLIVIVLCLPLAISNLDDNIQVQIVAFVMTLVVSAEWVVESSFSVKASRVPTLSVSPSFGNLLGPIIINYACTIFVPSWINLKRQNVNAQRTVWLTMTLAIFVYTLMGLFPALAFDGLAATGTNGQTSNAIANFINPSQAHHVLINKITCYAFSIVMLLPAIPVSFIVSEQNIVHNFELGGWGKWGFKFVCFVLPWLLIIPMQTGSALGSFMNWTGVLLVSPANFVIPFVIYLKCLRFRREYNEHRGESSCLGMHLNSTW
ncbi:hypothetical protein BC830DRAFT_667701 [Chytriomyces sp. MP71]|nr:hypothetical protein BC830DRAFT_667701 [Chytriomyces sp. MP71]